MKILELNNLHVLERIMRPDVLFGQYLVEIRPHTFLDFVQMESTLVSAMVLQNYNLFLDVMVLKITL